MAHPPSTAETGTPVLKLVPPAESGAEAEGLSDKRFRRAARRLYTLLWSEWFAHSRLLLVFLIAWLALVWLLPLITHPLWILALGPVFALMAGPMFGGADIIDGCEEFMMGLPPTRSERFAARLFVAAASLMTLTGMNLLALGLNLSDVLDRVFLNTGLIQAVQLRQPDMLYALVAVVPFSLLAFSFSIATLARSRTVAFASWLWGGWAALGTLRSGLYLEELEGEQLNGRYSVPILVSASVLVLFAAWRLYLRKEAGADAAPLRIPLSWWGWFAGLIAGGIGLAFLLSWYASNLSRLL